MSGIAIVPRSRDLNVVILEDHPLLRDALLREVESLYGNVNALYKGPDVDAALACMKGAVTDIVFLDLDLGTGDPPITTLSRVLGCGAPVVIVSALGSPSVIQACLSAGATGFVAKHSEREQLADAILAAIERRTYTSPEVAAVLVSDLSSPVKLSPQEARAAVLYASGMKLTSVARTMGVSTSTAQEYINRVREKYDAAGRPSRTKTDLYRVVREDGLIA